MSPSSRLQPELRAYAREFRDHEGISANKVARWIDQWGKDHKDLASKVLREIRFYSAGDIRTMLQRLVDRVYMLVPEIPRQNVAFVPAGRPYSGSAVLGRALRGTARVRKNQILSIDELLDVPEGQVQAVAVIEDFSGSGDTLEDWWYTVEPAVLPKVSTIIFGVLVLNSIARSKLEQFTPQVVCVEELAKTNNVLSPESVTFDAGEKELLLHYCERTGCGPEYHRGYKDCGLLVAFKHFCPNNSLPILWCESDRWRNLFMRTAI